MTPPDPYTWHEPLYWFYRDIQEWIDEGCPEHPVFMRIKALCHNIQAWEDARPIPLFEVRNAFECQLANRGLDLDLPFNQWFSDYQQEDNHYLNPLRLAWIKDHAQ